MSNKLYQIIMNDGSRHFGDLPEVYPWDFLRERIKLLSGALETNYVSDQVTEFWLDFTYKGNNFSINNQFGEFWFFVENPNCSDDILLEVLSHFGKNCQ